MNELVVYESEYIVNDDLDQLGHKIIRNEINEFRYGLNGNDLNRFDSIQSVWSLKSYVKTLCSNRLISD